MIGLIFGLTWLICTTSIDVNHAQYILLRTNLTSNSVDIKVSLTVQVQALALQMTVRLHAWTTAKGQWVESCPTVKNLVFGKNDGFCDLSFTFDDFQTIILDLAAQLCSL